LRWRNEPSGAVFAREIMLVKLLALTSRGWRGVILFASYFEHNWSLFMPKKRPVTKNSVLHLKEVVHEGFSSLLIVRSILSGHFKRDERLKQKIERLVEDYADFKKDCEAEFSKRTNS
jgi:hypothetical protein